MPVDLSTLGYNAPGRTALGSLKANDQNNARAVLASLSGLSKQDGVLRLLHTTSESKSLKFKSAGSFKAFFSTQDRLDNTARVVADLLSKAGLHERQVKAFQDYAAGQSNNRTGVQVREVLRYAGMIPYLKPLVDSGEALGAVVGEGASGKGYIVQAGGDQAFLKVFRDGKRPKLEFQKPSVEADPRIGQGVDAAEHAGRGPSSALDGKDDPSGEQPARAGSRSASLAQVKQGSDGPRSSVLNAVQPDQVAAEEQQPSLVKERKSSVGIGQKELQHASENLAESVGDNDSYDEMFNAKFQNYNWRNNAESDSDDDQSEGHGQSFRSSRRGSLAGQIEEKVNQEVGSQRVGVKEIDRPKSWSSEGSYDHPHLSLLKGEEEDGAAHRADPGPKAVPLTSERPVGIPSAPTREGLARTGIGNATRVKAIPQLITPDYYLIREEKDGRETFHQLTGAQLKLRAKQPGGFDRDAKLEVVATLSRKAPGTPLEVGQLEADETDAVAMTSADLTQVARSGLDLLKSMAAHGFVHGDIKGTNLMLDKPSGVLNAIDTDNLQKISKHNNWADPDNFGDATRLHLHPRGVALVTKGFISTEQAFPLGLGRDLYAFGVTLLLLSLHDTDSAQDGQFMKRKAEYGEVFNQLEAVKWDTTGRLINFLENQNYPADSVANLASQCIIESLRHEEQLAQEGRAGHFARWEANQPDHLLNKLASHPAVVQ
jgi:hypothetical protein